MGKAGKTLVQMAARFEVTRDTLYQWAVDHADFSDALDKARVLAQAWWEEKGQEGDFNPGLYKFIVAARFADYRETKSIELSGPGGGPIKSQVTLTPEEAYKALLNG
jgi:hypothetical protein